MGIYAYVWQGSGTFTGAAISHRHQNQHLMGTVCQVSCANPSCPWSHPFAVNNGTHCCGHYIKENNSTLDASCDGSQLLETDPVICCFANYSIECPDEFGLKCQDHTNAERKSYKKIPTACQMWVSQVWSQSRL